VSPQHILSEKLVVLIPPCLIVELFLSKLQVYVTRLEIRGTLPSTQSSKVWSDDVAKKILNPSIVLKRGNETGKQVLPLSDNPEETIVTGSLHRMSIAYGILPARF
jgi:hypothetical protein